MQTPTQSLSNVLTLTSSNEEKPPCLSEAASHLGSSLTGGVEWDENPGLQMQLVLGSCSYLCFSFTDMPGWR